jgi:hypothetical protein
VGIEAKVAAGVDVAPAAGVDVSPATDAVAPAVGVGVDAGEGVGLAPAVVHAAAKVGINNIEARPAIGRVGVWFLMPAIMRGARLAGPGRPSL